MHAHDYTRKKVRQRQGPSSLIMTKSSHGAKEDDARVTRIELCTLQDLYMNSVQRATRGVLYRGIHIITAGRDAATGAPGEVRQGWPGTSVMWDERGQRWHSDYAERLTFHFKLQKQARWSINIPRIAEVFDQ